MSCRLKTSEIQFLSFKMVSFQIFKICKRLHELEKSFWFILNHILNVTKLLLPKQKHIDHLYTEQTNNMLLYLRDLETNCNKYDERLTGENRFQILQSNCVNVRQRFLKTNPKQNILYFGKPTECY